MTAPRPLTTGEAAQAAGVSIQTLIRWLDDGSLRGWRIPGSTHRRVEVGPLREFLRARGMPLEPLDVLLRERR